MLSHTPHNRGPYALQNQRVSDWPVLKVWYIPLRDYQAGLFLKDAVHRSQGSRFGNLRSS